MVSSFFVKSAIAPEKEAWYHQGKGGVKMKIAIFGHSGSGKSTLGAFLGELYGAPVLHLDVIAFEEGWKRREMAESRALAQQFMEQDSWIIEGNYRGMAWETRVEEADQLIYMNFPRLTCLKRAWKRYRTYRGRTRESIAPGCPEKLDLEFVLWILWQGRTPRRLARFRKTVKQYQDKTVVLKNQRQLDAFMEQAKKERMQQELA